MKVVFSKDTFSIIFQQFKKCLFKIHFWFSKFLKNVSSRDIFSLNLKFLKVSFQKDTFGQGSPTSWAEPPGRKK